MENTTITLENVLEQASNWTFAGDFTLLQWMSKISQDLDSRANETTEALRKLDNNVRSTNIALDNVANSLTTLQFGNQFVESRVQDDETFANTNEAISKESNKNEETPSSKQMLNTFLDNNLKILRNCHEKYSLDLDDSEDDDDGPNEKTCIYQPINPYNERPLPFIFGSKDWYAKWHVGLFENQDDNNYSGDEISETFSESSQSPPEDNESFESNTEWTSSNSVDNNYNANIKVRNASSLRGSQPLLPGSPSRAFNATKTNITTSESSTPSSLANKSMQTQNHIEIKPTRSESINSINSNASTKTQAITKENASAYSRPAAPFLDLFAEPPEDIQSIKSTVSSTQHTRRSSVDFTSTIPSLQKSVPVERPSLFSSKPPPFVDLFSEPPEDITSAISSSVSSNRNIKRKPLNLFDDDNNFETEDDLLTHRQDNENKEKPKKNYDLQGTQTQKEDTEKSKATSQGPMKPKTTVKNKPLNVSTTPKSLFDEDSDEDDNDFLEAFAKKSSATKSPLTNTLLFDNDYDFISEPPKKPLNANLFEHDTQTNKEHINDSIKIPKRVQEFKSKRVNIFDDIEDDEDENFLFRKINKNKSSNILANPLNDSKGTGELEKKIEKIPKNTTDNLFDGPTEIKRNNDEKSDSFAATTKKKINLFDDLEDDDYDFFALSKSKLLNLDSNLKQTSLKQHHDGINSLDNVNSEITSKIYSQEILTKPNEAADNDLNNKEIPISENTNDTGLPKTLLKSFEDISEPTKNLKETTADFEAAEPGNITEREFSLKPDKVLDITKDQPNKSLQNIPANRIESQPKPQVSYKNTTKGSLKENINEKLNKEQNNNTIATDAQAKPEVLTSNIFPQNKSTSSRTYDLGVSKTADILNDETPSTAKETESSAAPTKYDFNSIMFLDEPPEDDSEFFETLSKTQKTPNTKYNSIDLEHDLYEPDLPKVPISNATIIPVDSADSRQPTLYTGLQLFSDVPPDDDDNDNTNKIVSNSSQTKRLHSVFYDDFNETLAALNKTQEEKMSTHSISPIQKSPPLNEDVKLTNPNSSKDVVDHKLEDNKEDLGLAPSSKKRSVSKLQMPNISINVQALLPGANTTLRKSKEDTKQMAEPETTESETSRNKVNVIKAKELSSKTETVAVARTAETEHILPSVTKNRVRAPTTRRPSTRKARQDNYHKSLLEDAQEISQTVNVAIDKTTLKKENFNVAQKPSQVDKLNEKSLLVEKENTKRTETLFDNETENKEDIFKKVKTPTKSTVTQASILNVKCEHETHKDFKGKASLSTKHPNTKDIEKPSTSKPFDDQLEGDTTLFNNIIQTNSSGNNIKKPTASLLFDDDEEVVNCIVSQALPKDKIQTEYLEEKKNRKATSSLLFDSDEEEKDSFDFFKNIKTSKSKDTAGAIKKNEQRTLQQTENLAETIKSKGSLLFDDDNEDDDDDFFKRLNSKDTKKEVSKENNKFQSETTKTFFEKEPTKVANLEETDESSDSFKHIKTLKSTVPDVSNISLIKDKPISKLDSNNDQIKHNIKSDSFLDDDTLFGTSKITQPAVIKPDEPTSENRRKTALTFQDGNKDVVQTTIPATEPVTKQTHSIQTLDSSKRNVNNKKHKFISFLDNESDDDDFTVAGLQTKKSSQATKPAPAPTTSSKTSTQHKAKKSDSSKLFADSDTDSDDLFGKLSPKKPTITTTAKVMATKQPHISPKSLKTKPQASLFSDDSDDGNDFLKTSGSVTKKDIPKNSTKENSSKVTQTQSNASLFSDIDSDEDDLFGSVAVTKPTSASIISNVKTPATTQPVAKTKQTAKAKTSTDNPLADLL